MAQWLSQARAETGTIPPSLQFPWERGFLGVVFGYRLPLEPFGYIGLEVPLRVEPVLAEPPRAAPAAPAKEKAWQPTGVCTTVRVPRLRGTQPVDENGARAPIVARWRWLLEVAGPMSDLYRRSAGGGEEAVSRAITDACYSKSTATLRKRACSLSQYLGWAGGRKGLLPPNRACTSTSRTCGSKVPLPRGPLRLWSPSASRWHCWG